MGNTGSAPICAGGPVPAEVPLSVDEAVVLSQEVSLAEPNAVIGQEEEKLGSRGEAAAALEASSTEAPHELSAPTSDVGKEADGTENSSEERNKAGKQPEAPAQATETSELEVAAKKHLIKKASAKKPTPKKASKAAGPTPVVEKAANERVLGMGLPKGCQCNPADMLLPGQKAPVKGERRCPLSKLSQEVVDAEFEPVDPANDPLQHLSEAARQEVIERAKKRAAGYEKLGKTMEQECNQQ